MKPESNKKLKDGDKCKVVSGTHAGKSGTVTDIKTSKTGYITITVVQAKGGRFKTLAKNVTIENIK
jgi:ribosomal protein S4E